MIIGICTFTENGTKLADQLQIELSGHVFVRREQEDAHEWTKRMLMRRVPLIFIGASGIAVRMIAPYVQDKLTDSPVLVMDELGRHVISLLSGHMGGANDLALEIARAIGADPVITTATDIRKCFSVDLFAKENGFRIVNRDGIRKISSKLLAKDAVSVYIHPDIVCEDEHLPEGLVICRSESDLTEDNGIKDDLERIDYADLVIAPKGKGMKDCLLRLEPKLLCVGMGCRKGKQFEQLQPFLKEIIEGCTTDGMSDVCEIASIDLKEREIGLLEVSAYHHIPFVTYSAEELLAVEGTFQESDFVCQMTGVPNVCERSAVKAAGDRAVLIVPKTAKDGMTIAVAQKKRGRIHTWNTTRM